MHRALLVFAALLALGTAATAHAQSASKPAEKSAPPPPPPAARTEPAKPAAPPATSESATPAGVQKMATDFSRQREAQLDDRRALLEKLRLAKTAEEKQRLLAELRQQQQQRLDEQREAARLTREQLRDNRK